MPIAIEFKLGDEEVRAALRAYSSASIRRGVLRLWLLVGLIFLVLLALTALSLSQPSELREPAVMIFAAWALALPLAWRMAPKLASRETAPAFVEPTEVRFDEEFFSVSRSTFAGSGSWAHFRSWRELDDFFILAHSPSVLLVLPKRAFDDPAIEKLRELLGRVIGD